MNLGCNYFLGKNKHYCKRPLYTYFFPFFSRPTMSYVVSFDTSCLYNLHTEDNLDINKLFGFSEGLHHKSSARFGWNVIAGRIHLYNYCYVEGIRVYNFICFVEPNVDYKLTIRRSATKYTFLVNTKGREIKRKDVERIQQHKWGYKLWPYFGGNCKAPHDMLIQMK